MRDMAVAGPIMCICAAGAEQEDGKLANAKPYGLETRVRILSWNLWWKFGPWQDRKTAILATLRDLDADVICLQEIWNDGDGNLAADLAAALGYHHVYAESMVMNDTGFGNAILSRWPIGESDTVELSGQAESGEGRNGLYALVNGPRGDIPVFCTHLNYRYQHSHIRQKQVADLSRFVDSKRPWKFPPVVCGDFNAEPESDEMRMLTGLTTCPVEDLVFADAWNVGGDRGHGFTWANDNPYAVEEFEPDRRIDYIYVGHPKYRGAGHVTRCEVVGNTAVDGVMPSDHYGVLAHLRY